VNSEKSLVEFMRKANSSYLLVANRSFLPPEDDPPLLKLVESPKQRKKISTYEEFMSTHRSIVSIYELSKGTVFDKIFLKIYSATTEGAKLNLYRLTSDVSLDMIPDGTRPRLFVTSLTNGTTVGSGLLNITGFAIDVDSMVKKVEVSLEGSPFQLANPKAVDDWSSWYFTITGIPQGTKKILVKATDNANNEALRGLTITVK
jgi:hypothetical protein